MDRKAIFFTVFIAVFFLCAAAQSLAAQEPLPAPRAQEDPVSARTSPFLTMAEDKNLQQQGNTIPIYHLEVTAIFYSPEAVKSRAVIEGMVLSVGDSIDNKKVVFINPEDVVLQDSQAHYVVRLKKIAHTRSS